MNKEKQKWLVVANWKMNPVSQKLSKQLFNFYKKSISGLKNTEIVLCPPYIYMSDIKISSTKMSLGSQDLFFEPEGAFTGNISYLQLKNLGVKYSLVGHSEKRLMGETDEIINLKIKSALRGMITPIICVGESSRDSSGSYLLTIKDQIQKALLGLPKTSIKDIVVAYEPVWAIGDNAKREPTPKEIFEVVIYIKKIISDLYATKSVPPTKILYGGSVNYLNVNSFIFDSGVDGFLVGRASLNQKDFAEILKRVDGVKK
jgi:triosephosphate isomerase